MGRLCIGVGWGAVLTPFFANLAFASAWNPDPWKGELISGYVFVEADTAINDFGDEVALDVYDKQIVQTYGNLGLTPSLALIGTFDWQDAQIIGPGVDVSFSEPSSLSAGLQYQVSRREGHAVAIALSYVEGIDFPDELLTLESRENSVELRGLWGESRTITGRNVFAEAQIAGRMTIDGRFASAHAQLTLGGNPTEKSMLLFKGRYTDLEPGNFERLAIVRQTRWEAEASAVYQFRKRDYIELGYSTVLSGRSAVMERGWKIGFWRKF